MMIIHDLLNPNLIIISSLLIGALNLLIPLVISHERTRLAFMLFVSIFFLSNIVTINLLFLKGIRTSLTLTTWQHYTISFHLEALGLIFLDLLSFLWIAALIYTPSYLKINNIGNRGRFLFFMNLSLLIGVLVALSANLITMFIFYELLTISTAPLVAHEGGEKACKGLYRYLKILLISSMMFFLPAVLIIYSKTGGGDFVYQGFLSNTFTKVESIALLLMCIFGISKTALFPLHRWLPAAMVAPHPVSALLHAVVVVKAGLFCTFKVLTSVFGLAYLDLLFSPFNWLVFLPAITMIYSGVKALRLNNIKMILAYSTINQLSIALISAFMFTSKAIGAAILHMLSHSFSKICLFYAAGIIYSVYKVSQVEDLKGIAKKMPKTSLMFVLATLSLVGMPPLAGFVSKFYIIMAAAHNDNYIVAIIVAISTILSALYMIKMLLMIYSGSDSTVIQDLIEPEEDFQNWIPGQARNDANRLRVQEGNDHTLQPMLFSLLLCGSVIICFFLIARFINHFLLYI